jgi:(S)-mandelate dehydrogenase
MAKDNTLGAYNIHDLRELAQKRLPKGLFEFMDRGTEDEVSLRNNREVFEKIRFRPRTLVDVSKRTQEITLLGQKQKMPICVAPTGVAGLMWYEGEMALARAAKAAGIPFTCATGSLSSMEQIAEEIGGRLWFQLYMWEKVALSHELVHRANKAGYEALLLTVDTAVSGNREFNLRNGFAVPFKFNRKNVTDVLAHPRWLV